MATDHARESSSPDRFPEIEFWCLFLEINTDNPALGAEKSLVG